MMVWPPFQLSSRVLAILTAILAAVLVKSAVSYANMAVLGVIYGRLSHKLRTRIFAAIVTRPLAEVERERLGKLLNILNNETWRATDALNCIFTMITSLMVLMVFVTLLFLLSWRLALIAVLCMGFIPPVIHLIARRAKKLSKLGLAASETSCSANMVDIQRTSHHPRFWTGKPRGRTLQPKLR